ncbi:zinc ribbon domain-containing protein [Mycolicibacterium goodii]|uniref:zinc ribbon domain-containing protein n=1 Tax=Mycolicibacterium goodii TaxID=134601 RepID=UPI003FD6C5DD
MRPTGPGSSCPTARSSVGSSPSRRGPRSGPGCARCPVWRWCSRSTIPGGCGAISSTRPHVLDELPLQIRMWVCPACQVPHDRDFNAAKVILAAGRAERLNACGARVRPQLVAAVGVETGSAPTAGLQSGEHVNRSPSRAHTRGQVAAVT